jgi:hypothetical protein
MSQVDNNRMSFDKVQSSFKQDFGSIQELWSIEAKVLQVEYVPI